MAFDGMMMYAVSLELARELTGGRIEKIYQPRREELLLHIHTEKGRRRLFISACAGSARINLTERSYENPTAPPTFCMLLRKHIQGGRITDIRQVGSDRIMEISIETADEMAYTVSRKLIVEVMGKHSNISLVEAKSGRIIDGIKRVSVDQSRMRQIMPGLTYEYPPAQSKIPFKEVTAPTDAGNIGGISSAIAEEISGDIPDALTRITSMISRGEISPCIYYREDGIPADFSLIPLSACEGRLRRETFDDIGQMIDRFYEQRSDLSRNKQMTCELAKNVNRRLKKMQLKKQRLYEDLERARNSEHLRLCGEILTANLHQVESGISQVTLTNYYTGEPLTIPLDVRYSPARNAQNYFKAYAKSKTAVREKTVQIEENDREMAYLESVQVSIDNAENPDDIESIREELIDNGYLRRRKDRKKRKPKASPAEYTTAKGFRVLAGRNNTENDYLTLKLAAKTDLWFHTKDIPGSHVILFLEGREADEETILETARIAAKHSKAARSSNVPVDYVPVRYVKKPAGARPGMVIFTHNRTVYVTPEP